MGVKVKGGMWCDHCRKPVAGQKSTKIMASAGKVVASGGTYAPAPGLYHCPTCGSTVRPATKQVSGGNGWAIIGVVFLLLLMGGCTKAMLSGGDAGPTQTTFTSP